MADWIVYVGFAQRDEWEGIAPKYARHVNRFEEASGGLPCLLIPYWHATPEVMERLSPRAVLLSGFGKSFEEYDVKGFLPVVSWVEGTETPVLALCGSHQLLGFHYNQDLRRVEGLRDEPMRRLRPGEPVTNPDYHPQFFMERGFYALDLTEAGRRDPLFEGLSDPPYLFESHYCEVKTVPPGFELLASTPECRIQALRHRERVLYTTQFHPEEHSDDFPDGKRLLANFFRIAGVVS